MFRCADVKCVYFIGISLFVALKLVVRAKVRWSDGDGSLAQQMQVVVCGFTVDCGLWNHRTGPGLPCPQLLSACACLAIKELLVLHCAHQVYLSA